MMDNSSKPMKIFGCSAVAESGRRVSNAAQPVRIWADDKSNVRLHLS